MIAKSFISKDQFAYKYNYDHASLYYQKHRKEWLHKLSIVATQVDVVPTIMGLLET